MAATARPRTRSLGAHLVLKAVVEHDGAALGPRRPLVGHADAQSPGWLWHLWHENPQVVSQHAVVVAAVWLNVPPWLEHRNHSSRHVGKRVEDGLKDRKQSEILLYIHVIDAE